MYAQQLKSVKSIWQLNSINFFIADVMAGIGPFLGIFLLVKGWQESSIGTIMGIGGIVGMLMTTPAGALVDSSKNKKTLVIVSGVCAVLAACIILISQSFWVVSISQISTAIAGAIIGPAVIGITLGMVGQNGFNRQNGINQAYNHAGNVAGAAISGFFGMKYGMNAIIALTVVFGICSVISVLLIPSGAINDDLARGFEKEKEQEKPKSFDFFFKNKSLIILAVCLAFFHLGNAAMLPLYGMYAVGKAATNPYMFVALTVIIAQLVMIVVSVFAMNFAEKKGFWLLIFISFLALPFRGLMAAFLHNDIGLYPVQILDGIGAGIQSVAVPGLIARMLNGSGRINSGQGVIMTVQGVGAALSPVMGGFLIQFVGYKTTFLILGCFAIVSVFLWILFRNLYKSINVAGEN